MTVLAHTFRHTSRHRELWCRVRDDGRLLPVLLETLRDWYRPHMENTTTAPQNKILRRSLKIIYNTAQLDDTDTADRLCQLGTTDVLGNYLNSADEDYDEDIVWLAAQTLRYIVREEEAGRLTSSVGFCDTVCGMFRRGYIGAAAQLTENTFICRALAQDGRVVSALMVEVRQTDEDWKKWRLLTVLSRLCEDEDQRMAPSIKGQLLVLAVSEYRSNTGTGWGSRECRDEARKILTALRGDLEKRPEYRELCIELGFQSQDGGTGGTKRKRTLLEEDQVTSDFMETVLDPLPNYITIDLQPTLKRQTTLSRDRQELFPLLHSDSLQVAAPSSGLTGTTLSALHAPQPGRSTGPLQHVTQGSRGYSAATSAGQNIMTSQPLMSQFLQPQLMSQLSPSNTRTPQQLLTVLQPSLFPSFPVPSGSASQSSHPQTSTRQLPQSQPSLSWNNWASPHTCPGSAQLTLDSYSPLHHPATTTQHAPVSISLRTPTFPVQQCVPDSPYCGRVEQAAPPVLINNDLTCGSTIHDIPGVDPITSGPRGTARDSGRRGTPRDSGQSGQAFYTESMDRSLGTDRQRRPEDKNKELEDRLRHYEDEQRSLHDRNGQLEERLQQYEADESRLQHRNRELEEVERRDKEAIRQLQERNKRLEEKQGRDKVIISNLHNRQNRLQDKVKQLEDILRNYYNERAREAGDTVLKYREKLRKLEHEHKAYTDKSRELSEGAERCPRDQTSAEEENAQMEDNFTGHRNPSALDLVQENGQREDNFTGQQNPSALDLGQENGQMEDDFTGQRNPSALDLGQENGQREDDFTGQRNPAALDLGQENGQRTKANTQSAKQARKSDGGHSNRADEHAAMEDDSSGHQSTAPDFGQKRRRHNKKNSQSTKQAPGGKRNDSTYEVVDNTTVPGPSHAQEEEEGLMAKAGVYTQAVAKKYGMIPLTTGRDAYLYEPDLKLAMQNSKPGAGSKRPCDGTRLGRRLLGIFFSREERKLGSIAEQPKAGLVRLDKTITEAIIMRCLQEDPTTTRGKVRDAMASSLSAERVVRGKKEATRTQETQD